MKNRTNKWLINLTNNSIPDNVSEFLSLGPNFSVSLQNNNNLRALIFQYIKDIENNIINLNVQVRESIILSITPILHKYARKVCSHKLINSELDFDILKKTQRFLKTNKNILTRADNGNVSVAFDREDYIKKMEGLLSDGATYETVLKDPVRKIENNLNTLLKEWHSKNYITLNTLLSLRQIE